MFRRSLEARRGSPPFVFYEGRPRRTADPHAERPVARVQGHLPALPDDARALPRPARRLGPLRPARRDRSRAAAGHLRQAADRGVRHRRVQRALPRVGDRLRRRVGAADRADRVLGRHRAGLPDDGRRLHRERLVELAELYAGAACSRRATRSCLLPAVRHGPVEPRGRPRLRGGRDPSIFDALPWPTRRANRCRPWTATPWTLPANRRPRSTRTSSTRRSSTGGDPGHGRGARREGPRGGGRRRPARPGRRRLVGRSYAAPFLRRRPARGGRGRLRDDRGRHDRSHRPAFGEDGGRGAARLRRRTRSVPTGATRRRSGPGPAAP